MGLLPWRKCQRCLEKVDEGGLARVASTDDEHIERGRVLASSDLLIC